jgi:hypothetical protein
MLKFLEQLQLCYELKDREIEHYGQAGYLFNSLRPTAGTQLLNVVFIELFVDILQLPLDEQEDQEQLAIVACKNYRSEYGSPWMCKSCKKFYSIVNCTQCSSSSPGCGHERKCSNCDQTLSRCNHPEIGMLIF